MTRFWTCKTPTWSQYFVNIEYVSDPSVDLLTKFKTDIVEFEHPEKHPAFVECTHVQKSAGHMLFIIDGRVEVVINPMRDRKILFFVHCQDNQ